MRIRTVLPAIVLTAGVVLGATACEAGVEKKSDSAKPAPTGTPGGSGTQGSGTGTPAPSSASDKPSTPTAPRTAKAPSSSSTPGDNGPMVITGSGEQPRADCTGRDVRIDGQTISVALTGFCRTLTVAGESNSIEVAWFDKITVNGSGHLVMYGVKPDGTVPEIKDNGTSNRITTR